MTMEKVFIALVIFMALLFLIGRVRAAFFKRNAGACGSCCSACDQSTAACDLTACPNDSRPIGTIGPAEPEPISNSLDPKK